MYNNLVDSEPAQNLQNDPRAHKFRLIGSALFAIVSLSLLIFVIYNSYFKENLISSNQSNIIPTSISERSSPSPTPTPLPTIKPLKYSTDISEWASYSSSQAQLSFKYPSTGTVTLTSFNDQPSEYYISIKPDSQHPLEIRLVVRDNPNNLSIQEFNNKLESESDVGGPAGLWSDKQTKVTFDKAIIAYYQEDALCEPTYCSRYVWAYKGKIYVMTVEKPQEDLDPWRSMSL